MKPRKSEQPLASRSVAGRWLLALALTTGLAGIASARAPDANVAIVDAQEARMAVFVSYLSKLGGTCDEYKQECDATPPPYFPLPWLTPWEIRNGGAHAAAEFLRAM